LHESERLIYLPTSTVAPAKNQANITRKEKTTMFFMFRSLPVLVLILISLNSPAAIAGELRQSPLNPDAVAAGKYPMIVLYSTSWCPHCKAVKEYFTKTNIPFINRDVELDSAAMHDLTEKYQSQGVPVIVIGNDQKILKGFDQEKFEKALKEVQQMEEQKPDRTGEVGKTHAAQ
jgi:glutaredoxin 3